MTVRPGNYMVNLSRERGRAVRFGQCTGAGGGSEGLAAGSALEDSPVRSSASLKSTGPIISLMATAAMTSERKLVPMLGKAPSTTMPSPSARPACDTSPDQPHFLTTGGSPATRELMRENTNVNSERRKHSASAIDQAFLSNCTSSS